MGSKKNFSNLDNFNINTNPVEMFISKPMKEVKKVEADVSVKTITKKETKSKRLNLLTKPSTLEKLKVIADKYEVSVNDLINQLLEEKIKEEGK